MSLLHVLRAIISGPREDTGDDRERAVMESTSGREAPHQVLPTAYDHMVGFMDMGGLGNINSWWLP